MRGVVCCELALLGGARVCLRNSEWGCRFCLPRTLPPSFKGVSVRYSYTLQATAQYAPPKPFTPASSVPLSSSASVADPSGVENPSAQAGDANGGSSSAGESLQHHGASPGLTRPAHVSVALCMHAILPS